MSLAIIGYLAFFKPLESPLDLGLEIFDEWTILNLTYMLMCFSDFVPEEVTRSYIGWFYIAVSTANILVHLIIILRSSTYKLKLVFRRYRCCCMPVPIVKVKKEP